LRERIEEKDNPTEVKGGPYPRYILAIWTGELHLTREVLTDFLAGEEFDCSLITDALIGLNYHPQSDDPYPAIPIRVGEYRARSPARMPFLVWAVAPGRAFCVRPVVTSGDRKRAF
jgi:hypothetical protein